MEFSTVLGRLASFVVVGLLWLPAACTMQLEPYSPGTSTGSGGSTSASSTTTGGNSSTSTGGISGTTTAGSTSSGTTTGAACPIPTDVPATDDTEFLQGLLQAAGNSNSKRVDLDPNRTYVVNNSIQIPDGVTLQ